MELITPAGYYGIPKKERDSWGCGPGGFGDWFVPDTVYGLSVKPACQRHDFRYRFRKDKNEKTRKLDDLELLANLQIIIHNKTKGFFLRRFRFTRSRTMYWFVRKLGKSAYYG